MYNVCTPLKYCHMPGSSERVLARRFEVMSLNDTCGSYVEHHRYAPFRTCNTCGRSRMHSRGIRELDELTMVGPCSTVSCIGLQRERHNAQPLTARDFALSAARSVSTETQGVLQAYSHKLQNLFEILEGFVVFVLGFSRC